MKTERTDFSFKQSRILIVEDNRINQLLVKNVLKNFGFSNYDAAENSTDAFKKLSENNYDIILMDIQMPGMDGFEITREIRTKLSKKLGPVPIIALTGDGSENEREKARTAGINDYIVKPYDPEELYSILLKHLGKDEVVVPLSGYEKKTAKVKNTDSSNHQSGMELDFLEKYTGGDLKITMQLIELFLNEVPEANRKLEKLIPEANWKEVHAVSHKMKSCIAIFELEELRKIIIRIEDYSRDLNFTEAIPKLFPAFKEGCAVAVLHLEVELKKLKAKE